MNSDSTRVSRTGGVIDNGRGKVTRDMNMASVKGMGFGRGSQVWGKGRGRGGCTRNVCQHVKRHCRIGGGKGNAAGLVSGLGTGKCGDFFKRAKRFWCRRQ